MHKAIIFDLGKVLVHFDFTRAYRALEGICPYPAAEIPLEAVSSGARMIVVNAEPTPFDRFADVVIHGRSGEVLPEIARLTGE